MWAGVDNLAKAVPPSVYLPSLLASNGFVCPFFFIHTYKKSHPVRASSSSESFWNAAKSYEWKLTYTDSSRCACVWFRIQLQPVLLEFVVKLIKAERSYSISMIPIYFHYFPAPLTSYRGKCSSWCVYIIDVINSGVRLCGPRCDVRAEGANEKEAFVTNGPSACVCTHRDWAINRP